MQQQKREARPEPLLSSPRDTGSKAQEFSSVKEEEGESSPNFDSEIQSRQAVQQGNVHPGRRTSEDIDGLSSTGRYAPSQQAPSTARISEPVRSNSPHRSGNRSYGTYTNNTSPSSIFNSSQAPAYSSPSSLYATSQAMSGSPSQSSPSRHLITILPPAFLPHDPPHPRTSPFASGYGPPQNFRLVLNACF